jgi:hypothetical protein
MSLLSFAIYGREIKWDFAVKDSVWISKQKEYQMVPDTNTAKKDVHCAVFF